MTETKLPQTTTDGAEAVLPASNGWTMRNAGGGFRTVIVEGEIPSFPPTLRISRGLRRIVLSDFDWLAP